MNTFADYLYFSTVALLWAHELDAVLRNEWRLLPGLSLLDDRAGYQWFVILHVPLLVWFLAASGSNGFRIAICAFAIVHAGLHYALRNLPKNEFNNGFSWLWIVSAAVGGALFLLVGLL